MMLYRTSVSSEAARAAGSETQEFCPGHSPSSPPFHPGHGRPGRPRRCPQASRLRSPAGPSCAQRPEEAEGGRPWGGGRPDPAGPAGALGGGGAGRAGRQRQHPGLRGPAGPVRGAPGPRGRAGLPDGGRAGRRVPPHRGPAAGQRLAGRHRADPPKRLHGRPQGAARAAGRLRGGRRAQRALRRAGAHGARVRGAATPDRHPLGVRGRGRLDGPAAHRALRQGGPRPPAARLPAVPQAGPPPRAGRVLGAGPRPGPAHVRLLRPATAVGLAGGPGAPGAGGPDAGPPEGPGPHLHAEERPVCHLPGRLRGGRPAQDPALLPHLSLQVHRPLVRPGGSPLLPRVPAVAGRHGGRLRLHRRELGRRGRLAARPPAPALGRPGPAALAEAAAAGPSQLARPRPGHCVPGEAPRAAVRPRGPWPTQIGAGRVEMRSVSSLERIKCV
ncbi:Hypothetical predicted protein [Lynx pardinus]|uniref:Uncharacterized protein n=1 Tax=Lynx pardinus TaxID=191816 RepID=A0A485N7J8_LYNPA|nr:Hypothetical predicted protein [Lynx pardinus]